MLLQNGKDACKNKPSKFCYHRETITYTSNVVLSHRSLRSTPNIPDGSAPNLRKGKRTGEQVRCQQIFGSDISVHLPRQTLPDTGIEIVVNVRIALVLWEVQLFNL